MQLNTKPKKKAAFIDTVKDQPVFLYHIKDDGDYLVSTDINFKSSDDMYSAKPRDLKPMYPSRTAINKVSDNKKSDDKIYKTVRTAFLSSHPICEAKILGCTKQATEVHHKKGRVGKNYLDVHTFLALCNNCHRWIETHPEWAKEHGYSLDRL